MNYEERKMNTYYTTTGSVRGNCGHRHRSVVAAEQCRQSDANGCGMQGGYSDRRIVAVEDDVTRELNAAEDDLLERYWEEVGGE